MSDFDATELLSHDHPANKSRKKELSDDVSGPGCTCYVCIEYIEYIERQEQWGGASMPTKNKDENIKVPKARWQRVKTEVSQEKGKNHSFLFSHFSCVMSWNLQGVNSLNCDRTVVATL